MVLHFGDLAKVRGIVTFRLSPFEQGAMKHIISKGIPNVFRRCLESSFFIVPQLVLCYVTIEYMDQKHRDMAKKNPADYEDDV